MNRYITEISNTANIGDTSLLEHKKCGIKLALFLTIEYSHYVHWIITFRKKQYIFYNKNHHKMNELFYILCTGFFSDSRHAVFCSGPRLLAFLVMSWYLVDSWQQISSAKEKTSFKLQTPYQIFSRKIIYWSVIGRERKILCDIWKIYHGGFW